MSPGLEKKNRATRATETKITGKLAKTWKAGDRKGAKLKKKKTLGK